MKNVFGWRKRKLHSELTTVWGQLTPPPGTSTDLMPTLLGMYDSLIGRQEAGAGPPGSPRTRVRVPPPPPPCERPPLLPPPAPHPTPPPASPHPSPQRAPHPASPRPLSISSVASSTSTVSTASSSSSSGGSSSCPGGGGGAGGGAGGGSSGPRGLSAAHQSSAYLASVESLDDASDDDRPSTSTLGGGDVGASGGGALRYLDPSLSYAERVAVEVVDSERVYVRDLKQVIEGYLHYWRDRPDRPLSQEQLEHLFGNIEQIHDFNSGFLVALEECGLDAVRVARCFVCHGEGFIVYTQYCTNYPRAVAALTELMGQESAAEAFRERQAALGHALPLGSFLLKPVQRVLKYHLLLHNMAKHMSDDEATQNGKSNNLNHLEEPATGRSGRAAVEEALVAMTGVAQHINAMKRKHEHAVRVQEIQSVLLGWRGPDLTTFGELCAEGAFRVAGAKALRHVFLFERSLLVTKKRTDEGSLSYKFHILCSNLMLIESVPGEPLSFHVVPFDNPRLQYTLRARSLEQKREWALQIKRVILESFSADIPSHARQLVMELGQRSDEEVLAEAKVTPRRQHSAPEYLQRRQQERRRRQSEAGLRQRLRTQRTYRKASSVSNNDDAASDAAESPRRRRSASSGREGGLRERLAGGWRRKSEPGCYSTASPTVVSSPPTPTVPAGNSDAEKTIQSTSSPSTPALSSAATADQPPDTPSEDFSNSHEGAKEDERTGKSLEEVVGALLRHNERFQKLLQQRQGSSGSRQSGALGVQGASAGRRGGQSLAQSLALGALGCAGGALGAEVTQVAAVAAVGAANGQPRPPPSAAPSTHSAAISATPRAAATLPIGDDDDDDGVYETLRPGSRQGDAGCCARDAESDYVSLAAPADASVSEEKENHVGGHYDNLQDIWESVQRQQEEMRRLAADDDDSDRVESGTVIKSAASLRRVQSFCATDESPSAASSTVWLRQQSNNLSSPVSQTATTKRSGSLPRGFQLLQSPKAPWKSSRNNDSDNQRPLTVASEPPPEIDFDAIERYIAEGSGGKGDKHRFPPPGDTTEDDSLTDGWGTPVTSMQELHIHPAHKIYRPAASAKMQPTQHRASLRQVVCGVGARVAAGLRGSASTENLDSDVPCAEENCQTNHVSPSTSVSGSSERRASRIVSALALRYSRTLRQRLRGLSDGEKECVTSSAPTSPPPPPPTAPSGWLPVCKQGSSQLGARIAQCSAPDYADPQRILSGLPSSSPQQGASVPLARPDSALSASSSSALTSSSDGGGPEVPESTRSAGSDPLPAANLPSSGCVPEDSNPPADGSIDDSFYERSFEALDSLLENDAFRDSAVFSDPEETGGGGGSTRRPTAKIPPPVPAKPDALRCRLVQTPTPVRPTPTPAPAYPGPSPPTPPTSHNTTHGSNLALSNHIPCPENRKGWVRHVVGRLQQGYEN